MLLSSHLLNIISLYHSLLMALLSSIMDLISIIIIFIINTSKVCLYLESFNIIAIKFNPKL